MKDFVHSKNFSLFLITTCMFALGCRREPPAVASLPPPPVSVAAPVEREVVDFDEFTGRVAPVEEVEVRARVRGYLVKVNFTEGVEVKQGDVLAVLRIPELQREYEQKIAAVKQARASADQAQAAVGVAHAAVKSATAKLTQVNATKEKTDADFQRWQSEYARVAELADKGSITPKAADEAKNQMLAADAARKETDSAIESAKASHDGCR